MDGDIDVDVDPRQYEHIVINEKDVHDIILSYLLHNCYVESSKSFIACTGMDYPAEDVDKHVENARKINRIFHEAMEGNPLEAIELTEQLAQDVLEKNNKALRFDLLSLHFVDLVSAGKWDEAVEFAQAKLSPFGEEQKYKDKFLDFMSLLAYEDPLQSPKFYLSSLDYRRRVADNLNLTILAYYNLSSQSAMELFIKQTSTVRYFLCEEDGPLPFHLQDFLKSR